MSNGMCSLSHDRLLLNEDGFPVLQCSCQEVCVRTSSRLENMVLNLIEGDIKYLRVLREEV